MDIKNISELLKILSHEELEILTLLIKQSKSPLLTRLHYYIINTEIDESSACQYIYGEKPCSKYSHLKKRYANIIYTVLRINIDKNFDKKNPNSYYVNSINKIITSLSLISRNKYDLAWATFEGLDVSNINSINEEVDILLISYINRSFSLAKIKTPDLERMLLNYDKIAKISSLIIRNEIVYKVIAQKTKDSLNLSKDDRMNLISVIDKSLSDINTIIYSNEKINMRANRLLYKMSIIKYEMQNDMNGVYKTLDSYLSLLARINTSYDFELGGVYYVKALYKMKGKFYIESIKYINKACNYFIEEYEKYIECKIIELLCHLFLNNKEEFKNGISLLKSDEKINKIPFYSDKLMFIEIASHFLFKDYVSGYEYLNKKSSLFNDRAGWRIGVKYLEILYLINFKEYQLFGSKLESFRKLIDSLSDYKIARVKCIISVLRSLHSSGLNFEHAAGVQKNSILNLQSDALEYSWDPLGYEIVRFDEWFLGNLTSKQNLQFNKPGNRAKRGTN